MTELEQKILVYVLTKPRHRDKILKHLNRTALFSKKYTKYAFEEALHSLECNALIEELCNAEVDALNAGREFVGIVKPNDFNGMYYVTETGGRETAEQIKDKSRKHWQSLLVPDVASIAAVVLSIISLCVSCSPN